MVNARSFLVPFRYSHKVAYIIEFSHLAIRLYRQRTLVTEDNVSPSVVHGELVSEDDENENLSLDVGIVQPDIFDEDELNNGFEIETPYSYEDLWDDEELCFKLQTIQHSDVMYIFSEKHPIKVLKRYSNYDWRLEDLELKEGPFQAMNSDETMLTVNEVSGTVQVSANANVFQATDVGRLVRLSAYDNDSRVWTAGAAITVNTIYISDNKYYLALNGGTSGSRKPVHTEGVQTDGGVRWRYLHDGSGVIQITAISDARNATATVLKRLPDGVKNGTVYWELGLLHGGAKYPKSGAFFRNRFAFLVNTDTGPKVCLSVAGDYNNFADKEFGQSTAESAITVPVLNTEFNEGKWIYAGDVLFVGTGAAEFYIDSISASNPISNDNVKIAQISNVGSKAIMPVAVGGHIFFADRFGLSLRDLAYNYYNDGYDQTDVSLLGKHLFQAKITAICYQEVPDKILWCLTADGSLAAMTFSAEQEVAALSRHDFSGMVESIAVIPNFEACYDEVWLEVKRTINHQSVRAVEYMETGIPMERPLSMYETASLEEQEMAENDYVRQMAQYLDSAVLFIRQGEHTAEVEGLSHLEGEVVSIFADGQVLAPQVVLNGKVTIPATAARVLVGRPVISQYVPQVVYLDSENGTGIGDKQRISHLVLMLYLSGGGKIGTDSAHLSDILYHDSDEAVVNDEALFSGVKDMLFDGITNRTDNAAEVMIENDSPLPMNILAIIPVMN